MKTTTRGTMVAASFLLAIPASAETIYKLVDAKGNVTYTQRIPRDFPGHVERLDVDLAAPTAAAPPSAAARARRAGAQPQPATLTVVDEVTTRKLAARRRAELVRSARAAVREARVAFGQARHDGHERNLRAAEERLILLEQAAR